MKKTVTILCTFLISLLIGCPTPFNPSTLSVLQDLNPPLITITSPSPGSLFESTLTVSGTIIDCDNEGNLRTADCTEYIGSASFIIQNHDTESTVIEIDENGGFSFSRETASFENQITVAIHAEDVNGNTAIASFSFDPNTEGPNLVLTSPADYSEYATVIELAGWVTNSLTDGSTGEVASELTYRIPGTAVSGTLGFDADTGAFSQMVDVSSLTGNKTVELTATDLNGNTTTLVRTIIKPETGGDISGFTIAPGNGEVYINWDPVLGAESYSIQEVTYDMETGGDQITGTSYTWKGLENGKVYSFQLTAHLPETLGEDAVSDLIAIMPMTALTFAPWVTETDYKSITMEWQSIPFVSKYNVERRLSPDNPWELRGIAMESIYTDKGVDHDTTYHYRVIPSDFPDIPSESTFGVPGRFNKDIIKRCPTSATAKSITLEGPYAYVATGGKGLDIIDISHPDSPFIIGECDTVNLNEYPQDIFIDGSYAYLSINGDFGLQIIDISDPSIPFTAGTCDSTEDATEDDVRDVWVSGAYAYAADYNAGLIIINISDPSAPEVVGTCSVPTAQSVWVEGNYAYMAAGYNGVHLVDVSTKTNPEITKSVGIAGHAKDILVDGDFAYVICNANGNTFQVFDISPAGTLKLEDNSLVVDGDNIDINESGNTIYAASGGDDIQIIDVSTPGNPSLKTTIETTGWPYDVALSEGMAYIAAGTNGVEILDAALPHTPIIEGSYNDVTVNGTPDVDISGSYAYLCDSNRLQIIDISNPLAPSLVGTPFILGDATGVIEVERFHAYIPYHGDGATGMDIFDISNPIAPTYVVSYPTPPTRRHIKDVFVAGSLAYLAAESDGLEILDITNPEMPVLLGSYNPGGTARDVTVSGNYAFVACDSQGLQVIDISDPEDPSGAGGIVPAGSDAYGVAVAGSYAYMADGTNGLRIINISNPASPGLVTTFPTGGTACGVSVTGDFAFVVNGTGLVVVDISDPASPSLFGSRNTPGNAGNMLVSGSYAYIADENAGLQVIKLCE